ncbi:hypothetical protein ACOCJ7_00895 [Knoellia sp. CPCC 206453]|uniref:hypothetical protein n=1 Tax=Knoellia pratensis TaxID=3404796 RepID=UPI00360B5046
MKPGFVQDDRQGLAMVARAVGVVMGLSGVWLGLTQVGPAWSASRGHGIGGSFVVTEESCGKTCDYYGTFTSDDGRYTFHDVRIVGGGEEIGERFPVFYEGDGQLPDEVYAPGWSALVESAFFLVMGGGFAVGCVGAMAEPYLLRRPGGGRHERLSGQP